MRQRVWLDSVIRTHVDLGSDGLRVQDCEKSRVIFADEIETDFVQEVKFSSYVLADKDDLATVSVVHEDGFLEEGSEVVHGFLF